jgi:hypothetical protein
VEGHKHGHQLQESFVSIRDGQPHSGVLVQADVDMVVEPDPINLIKTRCSAVGPALINSYMHVRILLVLHGCTHIIMSCEAFVSTKCIDQYSFMTCLIIPQSANSVILTTDTG